MWRRKYRIIVDIKSDLLSYQIIKIPFFTPSSIYYQNTIALTNAMQTSIELILTALLNSISDNVTKTISLQSLFEIHLNPIYLEQTTLALPQIALSEHEILLFVEGSITKLFKLSANEVSFDYNKSVGSRSVNVVICKRDYVDEWIALCSKLNVRVALIGQSNGKSSKINLLPWRALDYKKRQIQLTVTALFYFLLTAGVMIFLYQYQQSQFLINSQYVDNKQLEYQTLIDLNAEIAPLQNESPIKLYQLLCLLSQSMPSSVLLETVNYSHQKVQITGLSQTYAAITELTELLRQQNKQEKVQIQSVDTTAQGLHFAMDMTFYE